MSNTSSAELIKEAANVVQLEKLETASEVEPAVEVAKDANVVESETASKQAEIDQAKSHDDVAKLVEPVWAKVAAHNPVKTDVQEKTIENKQVKEDKVPEVFVPEEEKMVEQVEEVDGDGFKVVHPKKDRKRTKGEIK